MSKNLLGQLRSRKAEDRIAAAVRIVESAEKPDMNDLLDCLSKHPGFARKKGRAPKDCQWHTKKALRLEWEPSFYRQIASDPYCDDYVLPDVYLDEQESNLLGGAKLSGESAFYTDGGSETLDVLKKLFDVDDSDVEYKWIKFRKKSRDTYGGYMYAEILKVAVGATSRALAILTNGGVIEVSAEELEGADDFVDLTFVDID